MDITAVKAVSVKPGDVLVLEIDMGMMPPSQVTSHIEKVKMEVQQLFPSNKIMVLPMHKIRLSVVNFEDAPEEAVEDVEVKE